MHIQKNLGTDEVVLGKCLAEPVSHATDHLRSVLNTSLGEITSSGGDEVLAQVEALRNELLTATTGKPRGAYQQALEQAVTLETDLRNLDAEIATYREKVDRLATLRRDHAADEAEQPWTAFRQQEQAAAASLDAIHQVEAALQSDRQRAEQIKTQVNLLRGQLDTFTSQEQAVATRKTALENTQQICQAQGAIVEQWQSRALDATARYDAARETLRLVRQEATRREHAKQLDDLKRKQKALTDTITQAEAEQDALTARQKQLAASEIDPKDLDLLREQQKELRELRIRCEAVATRLRFVLSDGSRIEIGNEAVTGNGDRPTLIILDDALVHSDETRLAQMKRLLFDAATRHQILLFTCHPANWRDLGVGARSLETLRTSSKAG